jgi:DNA polymerase-3 subunit delta
VSRGKRAEGLTYEEFRRQIKGGRIETLYLLAGEEDYLQRRAVELLASCLDEATRDFNFSVFTLGQEGPTSSAIAAIDAANQVPLIGARRVVIIRDFEKIQEGELEPVIEYLKRPAPTTTLVLQSATLDRRRKITTAALKSCTLVLLDPLNPEQAAAWVQSRLKQLGCQIEPSALGQLIGLVGTSLTRLSNEVEKLANSVGSGLITSSIVEQLVPRQREHANFELWDALLDRDRPRAMRLVGRLLEDGQEPLVILGTLASLYRRMLLAKNLMAQGAPLQEVMRATGQYGQRGLNFNARVNRTSREEIRRGLARIAETDDAMKNSVATPQLLLEFLIAELTLPEGAR